MRTTVLLLSLCLVGVVHAQTFFYIDAISVEPTSPTTADQVSLALSGGLASTGAQVTNVSASVVDFTVTIAINAVDNGGLTVIVPHTEVVPLGLLAAGTYTVVIDGQFVGDFAPVEDHTFVVSGTFPCEGLLVSPVRWHALTDTALVISVTNPTNELFAYPNFILLAVNGDTLAVEQTSLFGLPGSGSVHYLPIHPGAVLPSGPFNGRLELWTGFTTGLACSWELSIDLCPPPPCVNVEPFIQSIAGETATGTFNWGVLQNGNVVASGTFEVTEDQQYDMDEICLPPGTYSMICGSAGGPSSGALVYGLWAGPGQVTPTQPALNVIPQPIIFDLYLPCINPDQSVEGMATAEQVRVWSEADQLIIEARESTLREVTVIDAQGRLMDRTRPTSQVHRITTTAWAAGVVLVRVVDGTGSISTHRIAHAGRP
jgi:hypothetical protein